MAFLEFLATSVRACVLSCGQQSRLNPGRAKKGLNFEGTAIVGLKRESRKGKCYRKKERNKERERERERERVILRKTVKM